MERKTPFRMGRLGSRFSDRLQSGWKSHLAHSDRSFAVSRVGHAIACPCSQEPEDWHARACPTKRVPANCVTPIQDPVRRIREETRSQVTALAPERRVRK